MTKKNPGNSSQPPPIAQTLAIAMGHHQAGQISQAEQLYHQILQQQPNHVDALHLLGVAALQSGRHDAAIVYCERALALQPNLVTAHIHLGHARRAQGEYGMAIRHYQHALTLKPDLTEVHLNLSHTWYESGRVQEAIAQYQHVLTLQPRLAIAHYNLGRIFQVQGQLPEAIEHYHQTIALEPTYVEAYNNLGNSLMQQGKLDEAIAQYQHGLTLQPQSAGVYANLGKAMDAKGEWESAIGYYEQALRLQPDFAEVHNNLGDLWRDQNRMDEAIAHYEQAIALKPTLAEAHSNLGMALLRVGQFQRGFAEYEWRWRCAPLSLPPYAQPFWDGSELAGKTILLYGEQGLGDAIQFIRYVPLVKATGGRIIVQCVQSLQRLFSSLPDIDYLVVTGESLPEFDVHRSLMSLPHLLGTTLDTIPTAIPYLTPPSDHPLRLQPHTPSDLKVGLVWAGKQLPETTPYRDRSCPLPHFVHLLDLSGITFYSLQTGPRAADIQQLGWADRIHDLSAHLVDFADTAAAIAQLDLVISVDTAVAHLAGAMGHPVWVVLPVAAEWRWLLNRDDSPWYPTMRLIRQPQAGDWQGAIEQLM